MNITELCIIDYAHCWPITSKYGNEMSYNLLWYSLSTDCGEKPIKAIRLPGIVPPWLRVTPDARGWRKDNERRIS